MIASAGGMALGLAIGVRHALEPDHLAAVSTLVVDAPGARRAAALGVLWGIGHTIALVVVGTLLLATGSLLPDRAESALELGVAGMLVLLGALSLVRAVREGARGPVHGHRHGTTAHVHAGPAEHVHLRGRALAWRPLVVGLVHGLAGSGAITALVFAELPTLASRLVYIALFGVGSVAGMAIASGVAGASLHRFIDTAHRRRMLAVATGLLSIAVGVAWGVPQLAAL